MMQTEGVSQKEARREVVRCDKCNLVQFKPKLGRCVRCAKGFYLPPEASPSPETEVGPPREDPKEVVKRIAWRVNDLRKSRGLNQRQLQKLSGVSASKISRIEHGRDDTTIATLTRLAEAFECPLKYFFVPENVYFEIELIILLEHIPAETLKSIITHATLSLSRAN